MTFIFRNRTIFWNISKWNREQKKWDGGSTILRAPITMILIVKSHHKYFFYRKFQPMASATDDSSLLSD